MQERRIFKCYSRSRSLPLEYHLNITLINYVNIYILRDVVADVAWWISFLLMKGNSDLIHLEAFTRRSSFIIHLLQSAAPRRGTYSSRTIHHNSYLSLKIILFPIHPSSYENVKNFWKDIIMI